MDSMTGCYYLLSFHQRNLRFEMQMADELEEEPHVPARSMEHKELDRSLHSGNVIARFSSATSLSGFSTSGSRSGSQSSESSSGSWHEDSSAYDNVYKGIKAFLSKRPTFNASSYSTTSVGSKAKGIELGGPLTYAFSNNLRLDRVSSGIGSVDIDPLDLPLVKVTRRKRVRYMFHIDQNRVSWNHGKKELCVDLIKDIRFGDLARNYTDMYGVRDEARDLWCTIIYCVNKNKLKVLHVIAENKDVFRSFSQTLIYLVNSRRKLMEDIAVPNNEQFANIHWQTNVSGKKEDQNKDVLSFGDVLSLCNRYHIYCSDSFLQDLFNKADANHNGLLNFAEFQVFVKLLKTRPEIETIWNKIKNPETESVDFKSFYAFVEDVQAEVIPKSTVSKIFRKYCRSGSDTLDVDGLLKFLSNQPFLKFYEEDYTKPLNEYFISSSHNTYLLGKQFVDEVSVEAYIQALQQGCRCVEIDIWPGDHGPIVCHGLFTPSIPLEDVIMTIRKYAFITSPYPLILSLEIHCKRDYQLRITQIMKDILGDLIYVIQPNTPLLSPNQLKNRIILKSKKNHEIENDIISAGGSSSVYSSQSSLESLSESYDGIKFKDGRDSSKMNNSSSVSLPAGASGKRKRSKKSLALSKKIVISEKMLEISGIHGVTFRNFSLPESKTTTHCFSLNEKKFGSLYKDEMQRLSINKHNRRHLMRIYPHMLRYKSSNFNPIQFWKEGVQMVATNWQTYDLGQQLNHAMFQVPLDRDSIWHSGYVLKPQHLRIPIHKKKDIPQVMQTIAKQKIQIQLDVISGQMLSLQNSKSLAPYVEIEIISDGSVESLRLAECLEPHGSTPMGSPSTSSSYNKGIETTLSEPTQTSLVSPNSVNITPSYASSNKQKDMKISSTPQRVASNGYSSSFTTKCVKDNGFSPVWNASFRCVLTDTTFNFVKLTVKNGAQTVATTCIRLSYLKQGYRHIPLYNTKGEKFIFSTLFIHYRESPFATCI